jgi:hypothetical protein
MAVRRQPIPILIIDAGTGARFCLIVASPPRGDDDHHTTHLD